MSNTVNQDYIKNYLIDNKIIFPTNLHDNLLGGFQNYGPIGLKIKCNIINSWRKIFIQDDKVFNYDKYIAKFNNLQEINNEMIELEKQFEYMLILNNICVIINNK